MKVALFGATGGTGVEFLKQSQSGKEQRRLSYESQKKIRYQRRSSLLPVESWKHPENPGS